MAGHNHFYNAYVGLAPVEDPGANLVFNLGSDDNGYGVVASGTRKLPDGRKPGSRFTVIATGNVILTNEADVTVATLATGEYAECRPLTSTTWGATIGTAGAVAISSAADLPYSDDGGLYDADNVSAALDFAMTLFLFPNSKFTTRSAGSETAAAGHLTGARFVVWKNTANGAVAITTRTAAQMYSDLSGTYAVGTFPTFMLRIISGGDNTVTLTAGTSGVTVTGTPTAATGKFRDFQVTFASATAVTFQDVGGN